MRTKLKSAMSAFLLFVMAFSLLNIGSLGLATDVHASPTLQSYTQDFSTTAYSYSAKLNAGSTMLNRVTTPDNALQIVGASGDMKAILSDSPSVGNGELQADFVLPSGSVSFGFVFRYLNESNYASVMYTDTAGTPNKWELHGTTNNLNSRLNSTISQSAFPTALLRNVKYTIKINYDTTAANRYSIYLKQATDPAFTLLANISSEPTGSPALYTGVGQLAVRVNFNSTEHVNPVILDNVIQKDNAGNTVYTRNFNSETASSAPANVQYKFNKSDTLLNLPSTFTPSIVAFTLMPNDVRTVLSAATTGAEYIIDDASPSVVLGTVSANLTGASKDYGIVFNYANNNNFNMIKYNFALSRWELVTVRGGVATTTTSGLSAVPAPSTGAVYTNLKVDYSLSNDLVFYMNGSAYDLGNRSANLYTGDGKVGVATGVANNLQIDDVSLTYMPTSITAVTATNGTAVATLNWIPSNVQLSDFSGTIAIDGGSAAPTTLSNMVVNASAGTVSFNFPTIAATDVSQSVLVALTYNGINVDALPFNVPGNVVVTSIAVISTTHKTIYSVGSTLDVTSLKIRATFADSSTQDIDVTADMVSGFDSSTTGTLPLTITYSGKTTTFNITVGLLAILKTLQYNGIDIKGFISSNNIPNDSIVPFNVELPIGTTTVPTITAVSDSGNATITLGNAVSLPGTTTIDVTEGGITNKYPITFTVAQAPQTSYYYRDYNGASNTNWLDYNGTSTTPLTGTMATPTISGGALKLAVTNTGNDYVMDTDFTNAPADALYHAKVRITGPTANNIRFGFGIRGTDGRNMGDVNFQPNGSGKTEAVWHSRVAGMAKNPSNILADAFDFKPNVVYDVKVQVVGLKVTLYVDDVKLGESTVASTDMPAYSLPATNPANYGRFSVKTWFSAETVYLDDLYVTAPVTNTASPVTNSRVAPDPTNFQVISSPTLKVLVGTDFPFVYKYKDAANNGIANGVRESEAVKQMNINGINVAVTSSLTGITTNTAKYQLNAVDSNNNINATFIVTLQVIGNKLRMEFPSIVENAGTVVRSFYIPNHNLVAVQGPGAGVAVGQLTGWGPMADYFANTDAMAASKTTTLASYVLLNDTAYAQAIENNAMDGKQKYAVKEYVNPSDSGDKYIAVSNSAWYWHYVDNVPLEADYKPFAQVTIGGDQNGDSTMNWQDAGLLYKTIANQAYGAQDIKNNWLYIAMNMSNQTANPFVRVLDRGKAIAYLTDGFGQKVMNKGYQAGGHDDSHGDYDDVGAQQGGVADFNFLNTIGELYNIKTGIHINATEFPLDGFDTKLENLSKNASGGLVDTWNWVDQSWLVDKTKDVQSGELKRRLDLLKTTVPGLDFIYVDVYQSGSTFNAKKLAKYMNNNGWSVGTEAAGDFEEDLTFAHWNTDLYYPSGGGQSQVIRFVQNDLADKFAPDKVLLGQLMPGVAGWRNTDKFSDAEDVFYRENLPTKYLQHFTLQKWIPNVSGQFSGNVKSIITREDGIDYCNIYKNDILIAKIDVNAVITDYSSKPQPVTPGKAKLFIPWSPETEDKIYYYNDYETSSTWTLPNSWAGVTQVYQYQLTPNGRVFVGTVNVANNTVSLTGSMSTPYILTKTADALGELPAPAGTWGQGSKIANFGFTSGTLEGWTTAVTAGNPTGINVIEAAGSNGNYNDPMVSFDTNVSGSVYQTLTNLTPGKTYSMSAWVKSDDRPVTLGVSVNGQSYERSLATTAGIAIMMKPSKYNSKNYQRLEVEFTVPTGVTTAQLYFNAAAGTGTQAVYVDDFRSWEWPNAVPSHSNAYIVYEDFENVDENWGPFISQVNTQPYIHLTETNTNSSEQSQIKKYSIAGNTSLKDQQTGSGVHMRTLPSTLKLDPTRGYTVSFDYQTYREMRTSADYATGPVTYNAANNGFNVPQPATMYTVELRNVSGTVIQSLNLTPSAVSTPYSYNSAVTTQTCTFDVAADGLSGKYITISKKSASTDDMLVVDNFYVLDKNLTP